MKITHIIDSLINCFISIIYFIYSYTYYIFLLDRSDDIHIIVTFGISVVLAFYNRRNKVSCIKFILISNVAIFLILSLNLINLEFIYEISLAIDSFILLLNPRWNTFIHLQKQFI